MCTLRAVASALAISGCLAAGEAAASDVVYERSDSFIDGLVDEPEQPAGSDAHALFRRSGENSAVFYSQAFNRGSEVYAYTGVTGDAATSTVPSATQWMIGLDAVGVGDARRWNDPSAGNAGGVTVGYAWRKLKIEGSAFSIGREDVVNGKRDLALLDSTSSRVSYQPSPNWIFRLSRGNLSNLDQLEPGEELRRTALSASYRGAFANGDWRTTLAWGRNDRKTTGATTGYLLESTLRFNDAHALFARLERAHSNEDGASSESLRRQIFRMNTLTFGYFFDVSRSGPFRYDVGGLVARHLASSASSNPYGSDPTTGMMFVRLWLP